MCVCMLLNKLDFCYLLPQFSTDFYKVRFSGICMCQRLHILIFIKIFAYLRPIWPPKPKKMFYYITVSCLAVRWHQGNLLPGKSRYLPISCLLLRFQFHIGNHKTRNFVVLRNRNFVPSHSYFNFNDYLSFTSLFLKLLFSSFLSF